MARLRNTETRTRNVRESREQILLRALKTTNMKITRSDDFFEKLALKRDRLFIAFELQGLRHICPECKEIVANEMKYDDQLCQDCLAIHLP